MGKRSEFTRVDKDFYPTPFKAVEPLLTHLPENSSFIEPCAGDYRLVRFLNSKKYQCILASDLYQYGNEVIEGVDATSHQFDVPKNCMFITNPPWTREILHKIIENLSNQAPTWLLFDTDWLFTKQAVPFLSRLQKIVTVGRVKWVENSPHVGKDNCAWMLFDKPKDNNTIEFYGNT